jgi:hypothetical protein
MNINMSNDQIESPFIIGNIIKDPEKFWGRTRSREDIFSRLRKKLSTSIIGSRRIGKSSLAYYIYSCGPEVLSKVVDWLMKKSDVSS